MPQIRVGLIGLSAGTEFNWAAKAHLPYLRSSPYYVVVALANSSVKSAKAAIDFYKLDPSTRAYGNPEDLANDFDVDLVVISVNVRSHYALAKPALQAGKDIFMEWPVGINLEEAEELTQIARDKGVETMVSLQARPSSIVQKIKEIISSNEIGNITSTTVTATFSAYHAGKPAITEKAAYFADAKIGGNVFTIDFGHFVDTLNYTLGEFSSLHSILANQYETQDLLNDKGHVTNTLKKDTPDNLVLHGILQSGAVASIHFRTSTPVDGKGIRWLITGTGSPIIAHAATDGSLGTEGELEICSPKFWQWSPAGMSIRQCNFKSGEVLDVQFEENDEISKLPWMSVNVARCYEAFRKGETFKFASFEDAAIRHRLLDAASKQGGESGSCKNTN